MCNKGLAGYVTIHVVQNDKYDGLYGKTMAEIYEIVSKNGGKEWNNRAYFVYPHGQNYSDYRASILENDQGKLAISY